MQEIERFIDRVQGRRDKEGTVRNRIIHMECFAEWCEEHGIEEVSDIEVWDIEDYFSSLGNSGDEQNEDDEDDEFEGYSGPAVRGRYWSLNIFFKEMVNREKIEENPLEKFDKSNYRDLFRKAKKEDYVDARGGIFALEEEGVQELAENVPGNGHKVRNKLIILLSYHTGVRRQELADMKLDDIDRQERRIEVYSSKDDSNYSEKDPIRPVWYGPSLDPLMDEWIEIERPGYATSDSPYLFVSLRAERMRPHTINEIVKQAAENAGMQEEMYTDRNGAKRHLITHHTLRHSFARKCMTPDETGSRIDVKRLANLMGNDAETVSNNYLHFAEDDDRKARELYGPR